MTNPIPSPNIPVSVSRHARIPALALVCWLVLAGTAAAAADPRPQKGGVSVDITQKGIYRISLADLAASGIDANGVSASTFRLFRGSAEIPVIMTSPDTLVFYAPGLDTAYTGTDVYWLYWDAGEGRRAASVNGAPGDVPAVAVFRETLSIEENHTLWSDTPGAPDQDYWFWEKLTAPQNFSMSFDAPQLAASGNADVTVYFQGRSKGSHRVTIGLNGQLLGEATFTGASAQLKTLVVPRSALKSAGNQMMIGSAGDPGGVMYVNRVAVSYPKNGVAAGNTLLFNMSQDQPAQAVVTGFSSDTVLVLDVSDPDNPMQVSNVLVTAEGNGFKAAFRHEGGAKTYAAFTTAALKPPARMTFKTPSGLKAKTNGADWVLVSGKSLLPSLEKLCELRRRQGLQVKTAAIEDIYDTFSFGVFDPSALRDFLQYAAQNWSPAPRYVLLAGDSNLDYRDYFGTGKKNIVPVHLDTTQELGLTPSDYWFAAFDDAGPGPAMHIGRVSGNSPEVMTTIVNKLIRYESAKTGDFDHALLVADDEETAFETLNDDLAAYPPAGIQPVKIYARKYPKMADVTADILMAVDAGSLITSFVGHGDVTRWGAEPEGGGEFIIQPSDLDGLANPDRLTCILALNCLNGYFSQSFDHSLAEEWVLAADKGAVGCIAPSGLSHTQEHEMFGTAVFESIFIRGNNRLGDICTDAKMTVYSAGASENVLISMNVIGDPATRLAFGRNPDEIAAVYWIKAEAGSGGGISPAGETPVFAAANETFTITPADGYQVDDVKVDGVSQGRASQYTFQQVNRDHSISATFKAGGDSGGGGGGGGCFIDTIRW